ncbi:TerB family tellurite resistance protein [Aquimarina intermedia]|uniref:Tellurite resistance protein TerB n=1 Tax=Aquimarina intermedia TaxID=350814 RepID=A0A5S5BTU5_9FLAO|nr:TerB family tellurite resistance protein [Aquimarina intermedia]TYP70439.1 tellurite resistance protein TerB [Aquimarina intermedia]
MYKKEEKLSLLSEMIHFAKVDGELKPIEYDFILAVASQLGITKDEVDQVSAHKVDSKVLTPESQRILQFHRLTLLMNVDNTASEEEIYRIKQIGFKMGLRMEAMDAVLKEMHNYPNKVIPPQELMAIFTRFYN